MSVVESPEHRTVMATGPVITAGTGTEWQPQHLH